MLAGSLVNPPPCYEQGRRAHQTRHEPGRGSRETVHGPALRTETQVDRHRAPTAARSESPAVAQAEAKAQAEFKSYFAKGRVSGPAKIGGDRAEVPILFGPDGDEKEVFKMLQRDGKWFLESF